MSVYYGAFELKAAYQKNLRQALCTAASLHLLVIGGILMYQAVRTPNLFQKNVIEIRKVETLPPPLLLRKMPAMKVERPNVKFPEVGIPRAIPDEEVLLNTKFPTRSTPEELNAPVVDTFSSAATEMVVQKDPEPDTFIDPDELPVLINRVKPSYPEIARINKIEGEVTVVILVGTDGRVLDCRIRETTNEIFNDEAVAAVKQWVFKPAIQNKRPIKFWYDAPIVFKIE